MQRARYSLLVSWLLVAIMGWSQAAWSAPSRQVFGPPAESGKIKRLNLQAGELVVDDSVLKLSAAVAVYTHRGFETTLKSLRKGMRIAFNITHDASGSPSVSVIWILSKK